MVLGTTVIAAIFLYVLPGLGLLTWLWRGKRLSWFEQIGLAAGVSIALYPLLLLWTYVAGIHAGPLVAWVPGTVGLAALLWRYRYHTADLRVWIADRRFLRVDSLPTLVMLGLVALLIATRFLPVQAMLAPAWGDSVHHTFIVQLMLDNGGLFHSWEPYAPMQSMTYHYGFHASVAAWAWLTGMSAPAAVVTAGQVLNVLAVLAIYPPTVRLTGGNRWAGIAAVVVVGLLSPLPAFYLNWGRYTQLAGQIILPAIVWSLDVWWVEDERSDPRTLIVLLVLLAGLALTHYRVALLAAGAVIAWTLWGLWCLRRLPQEWVMRAVQFGIAALAALALIVPWIVIVQSGRLAEVQAAIAQRDGGSTAFWNELRVWTQIGTHLPHVLWGAGLAAGLLALRWQRRLAVPILLWGGVMFLLTNPFLLGLPGTGLITNFALVIALYIPIGMLLGWLIGAVWRRLTERPAGYVLLGVTLLGFVLVGGYQQLRIVDPFYQMVTPADERAFEWIEENVPADARFLVNGFLAYGDSVVVGADAGWWLPLYTERRNTVPPIVYSVERMPAPEMRSDLRRLAIEVRTNNGDAARLPELLCRAGITHVYLGQKRGSVGFGATPLVREAWLASNDAFALLYQQDQAQVWKFDRHICG